MTRFFIAPVALLSLGGAALAHGGTATQPPEFSEAKKEQSQDKKMTCLFCCNKSCNGVVANTDAAGRTAVITVAGGWSGFQGRIKIRD